MPYRVANTLCCIQPTGINFVDENPGSLRLVGGNQQRIFQGQPYWGGRLEIFWMGQWGTVCAVGFEVSHAQLACNQLGYHFWNTTETVGTFQGSFGQR